ncbi:hypothetical protein R1flu_023662 [Riccia fluitans]|uniref:Ubiquitin-like domain-containing protein n=1 Tax=Riccia fluitans TaxID=41844 RepID=A0ABD1XSN5_9MARC
MSGRSVGCRILYVAVRGERATTVARRRTWRLTRGVSIENGVSFTRFSALHKAFAEILSVEETVPRVDCLKQKQDGHNSGSETRALSFSPAESADQHHVRAVRKLEEQENVEDLYKRYACQTEAETPDIHVDEDTFTFFAREGGRTVELDDNQTLEQYHILDKTVLELRRLPKPLPEHGGRIFVETKDGILPLLGVTYQTQVLELKHALERMTGIPVSSQLLSSVGRIMHDEFRMKDFNGVHKVCEDSILDLCKSGDSNIEQGHKRMVVSVNVMGEQTFTMVVQGRDLVLSVLQVVEARTGVATWQQRITFSGKLLQEKKMLSDYHVHPECVLQVTMFKSPRKLQPKLVNASSSGENSGLEENKPAARKIKLLRTSKGRANGSVTIPVLTRDTVSDLRRKVRRTLHPLTERNFAVVHNSPGESNPALKKLGPSPSSKGSEGGSGRRLSRMLTFSGKSYTSQSKEASPTTSANASTCHSPESAVKRSNSKPFAARILSAKNFSGPLQSTTPPTKAEKQPAGALSASPLDGHLPDASLNPSLGSDVKPVAARVLKFRNFSGPLVSSPSRGVHTPPRPQLTLPLNSLRTASPAKPFGSNGGNIALVGSDSTVIKASVTPPKRTGENEQQSVAGVGTPLKFVHVRQLSNASNYSTPGISRNASIGSKHFTPTELHTLPEPCERALSTSEACLRVSETSPISLGGSQKVSQNVNPSTPRSEKKGTIETSPKSLVSSSSKKGNHQATPGSERKSLSAWFTDSMLSLKEHIRAPFGER